MCVHLHIHGDWSIHMKTQDRHSGRQAGRQKDRKEGGQAMNVIDQEVDCASL